MVNFNSEKLYALASVRPSGKWLPLVGETEKPGVNKSINSRKLTPRSDPYFVAFELNVNSATFCHSVGVTVVASI